ncbi:hypothetical protein QOT17_019525 [Balamuthia mandrillaris]
MLLLLGALLAVLVVAFLTKPTRQSFGPYFKQWMKEQMANMRQEETGTKGGKLFQFLDGLASSLMKKVLQPSFQDLGVVMMAKCYVGVAGDEEESLQFVGVFNRWYALQRLTMRDAHKWE